VPTAGGSSIQFYKDNSPSYVAAIGTYNPANNTAQSAIVFSEYTGSWAEQMRLNSTGLGIGTSSPTSKLGVNGVIQVTAAGNPSSGAGLEIGYGTVNASRTGLQSYNRTGSAWLGADYNALDHYFYTSGSERFRIASAGQLGIGGANYGTSGQVLTSGGSGAAPTWTTPSSGALTLIATQTPSGQADPTFTTGISSTYRVYKLFVQMYSSDSSNFTPFIRVYANGAVDTNTAYGARYLNGSTYTSNTGYQYSTISLVGIGSSVLTAWTYEITIYANFSQSSPYYLTYYTTGNTGSYNNVISASGYYDGASGRNGTITGIQVMTNGTPVNGRVSLYGVS
jgi:hypothetical protein